MESPVQILIVDDERRSAQLAGMLVERVFRFAVETHIVQSADACSEWLSVHKPDLLLLDIELNGLSAFDCLDCLSDRDFPIIITSASREFAFKAFEYGVQGYLLKPLHEEDLRSVLNRLNAVFHWEDHLRHSSSGGRRLVNGEVAPEAAV